MKTEIDSLYKFKGEIVNDVGKFMDCEKNIGKLKAMLDRGERIK